MKSQSKLALKIAKDAHKGQLRNDGVTPYIEHPIAVAKPFRRPLSTWPIKEHRAIYISAALLHDVIEDCNITKQDLIDKGVSPFIVGIVDVLTHKEYEPYLDYIIRVSHNYAARAIKIEDIKHNLSTLENTKKNKHQRDKYLLAIYILEH